MWCGTANICHASCGVQCWSTGGATNGGGGISGGCSGKKKERLLP